MVVARLSFPINAMIIPSSNYYSMNLKVISLKFSFLMVYCVEIVHALIFISLSSSFVLQVLTYEVYVLTGDKLGAGTKAVVKLTLFGEYGNSGERPLLRSRTHRTKFQRGQVWERFLNLVLHCQFAR